MASLLARKALKKLQPTLLKAQWLTPKQTLKLLVKQLKAQLKTLLKQLKAQLTTLLLLLKKLWKAKRKKQLNKLSFR